MYKRQDIYCGVEFEGNSKEAKSLVKTLKTRFDVSKIRFDENVGIGVKPISKSGTSRLVKKAIDYAIDNNRSSVTLVHKGNIMKYTEGAFRDWGYELAKNEYGGVEIDDGPWQEIVNPNNGKKIVIKDVICDAFLQQILLRPTEYDVIATMNLNGDYISDALAAQVGGIGIAPGANIGDGYGVFEATHGSAESFAGKNRVNPSSIILSGEMMLRYMGWDEAADYVLKGVIGAIQKKQLTFDLARARAGKKFIRPKSKEKNTAEEIKQELMKLVPGATLVSTQGFGDAVIDNM